MARGPRGQTLERWEVGLIKAMLARGGYNDQEILAHFTRPTRTLNHRLIGEVRQEARYRMVRAAPESDLDEFLANWPEIDPETGLSLRGDELLIKAREAMVAAVHLFNGAGLTFRAELFIVTAIIAWTYLLHAWFRREGIDYRHRDAGGAVVQTRQGEDKYWELGHCLRHARRPVSPGAALNLEFLLELRHEIEHRSTNRIDDQVSAKLQACCLNFNDAIKSWFGNRYGLEHRLPIALQFVTFSANQRLALKRASALPPHITTMMDAFHERLDADQQADPAFAYRVAFVPKVGARASSADLAVEFIRAETAEGQEINRVLLKEVNRRRYTPTEIWQRMQAEGFPRFNRTHHTELWQQLDAKDPAKGFGQAGDYRNTWVWFDSWLDRVRAHCQEHADRYR